MKNLDDIIRKLTPVRRRKLRKRAAELIAEHKAKTDRRRRGEDPNEQIDKGK